VDNQKVSTEGLYFWQKCCSQIPTCLPTLIGLCPTSQLPPSGYSTIEAFSSTAQIGKLACCLTSSCPQTTD